MSYRGFFGPHRVGQLRHELDRLLSGLTDPNALRSWTAPGRNQPAVIVWEKDQQWFVEMEVPGVKSSDVEIAVMSDEVTVKIERRGPDTRDVAYHRRERPHGTFTRVVRLPDLVDSEAVQAQLRQGVLIITLPKAESAKPRKIDVRTG